MKSVDVGGEVCVEMNFYDAVLAACYGRGRTEDRLLPEVHWSPRTPQRVALGSARCRVRHRRAPEG